MWQVVLVLSLVPLGPRLNVRFTQNRPFAQPGEFPIEWQAVYSAALEVGSMKNEPVFDEFFNWFVENACEPPLQLAAEEKPFHLLVCAAKCVTGEVPVIHFDRNGTRVRTCQTA